MSMAAVSGWIYAIMASIRSYFPRIQIADILDFPVRQVVVSVA